MRGGVAALAAALLCAGCVSGPRQAATEATMFEHERATTHRDGDDLLTAGLGLGGLRAMVPPAFADAAARCGATGAASPT